ncbi:NAD-dependent deacylase [Flavihumibacter rivuli]|uniref:SIR2 family NAD-dependent protein deacylase n=1 Tax=Flavihumibacter rivuli TaxID=2838156 RepID=UPI001BDF6C0C|nr:NAD-dependent deacylase [Flavihumibacter rivuli]ULQ57623.1 NAD-dependent deacylase [Flavihumibacter rivuli]
MGRKKLVVLTGAGISAESGLRTFRDSDGLWEGYSIEEVATPRAWKKDPQLVLDFYNMRRSQVREAQPNAAHYALAELEDTYEVQIITQNIDDLHERAGSSQVLHLHGEIFKMRSDRDEQLVTRVEGDIRLGDKAPDGGQYRPHIVWFEEPVRMIEPAIGLVQQADLFLIVGTSLVVYPAAGLVQYVPRGIPRYIVDKKIPYGVEGAGFVAIESPATDGLPRLMAMLKEKGI